MTSVYLIGFEVERYQSLLFDVSEAEFSTIPDLDGSRPLRDVWPNPPVQTDSPHLPAPDIWHLISMGKAFAVTPNVVERLEPMLTAVGELLPLSNHTGGEREFLAYHALRVLPARDCLDLERRAADRQRLLKIYSSYFEEDFNGMTDDAGHLDPWPILYPDFISDRLPSDPCIFRVDRLPSSLFLLDDDGASDTLLQRVTTFDLRGATFHKIWSSEGGAAEINLLA
jgi:hypothetical protein